MNCLIVPSLCLDLSLLDRLAASVDYPIKNKIIINNGQVGALNIWKLNHPDWHIFDQGMNLGVAGSFNLAPYFFPDEAGWLLMNDDGEFQPGCLERICKSSDEHAKDCHMIYINSYQAFDICVWTKKGFQEFGSFDENFWPAYFEDFEMRYRFNVGSAKCHIINDGKEFPVKHGKPRPAGRRYHDMLSEMKPFNEDYLRRKWGIVGDHPLFNNPFFSPNNKISEWTLESAARSKRQEIWDKFWNNNPSIYE